MSALVRCLLSSERLRSSERETEMIRCSLEAGADPTEGGGKQKSINRWMVPLTWRRKTAQKPSPSNFRSLPSSSPTARKWLRFKACWSLPAWHCRLSAWPLSAMNKRAQATVSFRPQPKKVEAETLTRGHPKAIISARGTTEPQGPSVGFKSMNSNLLKQKNGGKVVSSRVYQVFLSFSEPS